MRIVEDALRTRPPIRQQRQQVEDADGAVAVEMEVARMPRGTTRMR